MQWQLCLCRPYLLRAEVIRHTAYRYVKSEDGRTIPASRLLVFSAGGWHGTEIRVSFLT